MLPFASKYLTRTNDRKYPEPKKHLLVVDDDLAIRTVLHAILKKEFQVTTVDSGYAALAWLTNGNVPDLIISDISMPDISGFGLLKALSQSGLYNTIPVIIVSGHDHEEVESYHALYGNLKACLTKPFNPALLKNRINAVLDEELQVC